MTQTVTATEARVHFGAMLRRAAEKNETIVVERAGRPQAVILSVTEYRRLKALEEESMAWPVEVRVLRERLSAAYGSRTIPPSEEIIRRMRAERGDDALDLR